MPSSMTAGIFGEEAVNVEGDVVGVTGEGSVDVNVVGPAPI